MEERDKKPRHCARCLCFVLAFSQCRQRNLSAPPTGTASCPQRRTRIEDLSGLVVAAEVALAGTDVHVGVRMPSRTKKKALKHLLVPYQSPGRYTSGPTRKVKRNAAAKPRRPLPTRFARSPAIVERMATEQDARLGAGMSEPVAGTIPAAARSVPQNGEL